MSSTTNTAKKRKEKNLKSRSNHRGGISIAESDKVAKWIRHIKTDYNEAYKDERVITVLSASHNYKCCALHSKLAGSQSAKS